MTEYFSDQERGPRPRTGSEIPDQVWRGILAAIRRRVENASFGHKYPKNCPDGAGPCGCDEELFWAGLVGDVPGIDQAIRSRDAPDTLAALDAIQFCHGAVARPVRKNSHSYYQHHHLDFDPETGRREFREEINRLLERNGLVFELMPDGRIERRPPEPVGEWLRRSTFATGESVLDQLLEDARAKYLDPRLATRKDALEKLWDAWERLKTVEPPYQKPDSAAALLDAAAGGRAALRNTLEAEARAITAIGNDYQIRHSEVGKEPVDADEFVDYLFHRVFALIRMLLTATGRLS